MPDIDCLVVAPHPDDAELTVGGTILALQAQGLKVGIVDLTDGEPTPQGSREIRQRETAAATQVLGVHWRGNLGLSNRLLQPTLQARGLLAGVIRELQPRILIAPYWEDGHPDHVAASELTDAARFWAKLTKTDLPGTPHYPRHLYYYFTHHLRLHVKPSFVVDITPYQQTKMQALACYRSQFIDGRSTTPPTMLDDIRDRDRHWGWAIGTTYGEPLLSREEIGLRNLGDLV